MKKFKILFTYQNISLQISNFGKKFIQKRTDVQNTELLPKTIIRLPLFPNLEKYQDYILENEIELIIKFFN